MRYISGVASLFLLAGCSGPRDQTTIVTEAEFQSSGRQWPLTIPDVKLGCLREALFMETPSGSRYALNGYAMSGMMNTPKYEDIDRSIWKLDERHNATMKKLFPDKDFDMRISIGDLQDAARGTCRPSN